MLILQPVPKIPEDASLKLVPTGTSSLDQGSKKDPTPHRALSACKELSISVKDTTVGMAARCATRWTSQETTSTVPLAGSHSENMEKAHEVETRTLNGLLGSLCLGIVCILF